MSSEVTVGRPMTPDVVLGFIAVAILLGPVTANVSATFNVAMNWQVEAGGALAALLGGGVLLAVNGARGGRLPNGRQWLALLLLLVPRIVARLVGAASLRPWLQEPREGLALLLVLGAPLWLGLLASLRIIPIEVPRAVVAAGIAGVGGVLLVIPTETYALAANEVPMLAVHLLLSVAVVFTWWFARQRLDGARVLPVAGAFLLLSAGVDGVSAIVLERGVWRPVDWHAAAVPMLAQAALVACSFWLWFYLLERMPLTGFSLHPLAAWTASLLPELVVMRFVDWREDVAAAIVVAAIAVGIRARIADEQPTALGLGEG